jgi:hypothetical protein
MVEVVEVVYIPEFILQQILELGALAAAVLGDLILAPAVVTTVIQVHQTLVVVVGVVQEQVNQLLVVLVAAVLSYYVTVCHKLLHS